MKLRNVSLTPVRGGSHLQLLFTVKSKVQEPSQPIVRRLNEAIEQRTAALRTAPPLTQQFSTATHCRAVNLLSASPITPLRCVTGASGSAGKYRVLCRAVSVWADRPPPVGPPLLRSLWRSDGVQCGDFSQRLSGVRWCGQQAVRVGLLTAAGGRNRRAHGRTVGNAGCQ